MPEPKFSSDPMLKLFLEELMKFQQGKTDVRPSPTGYAGDDPEAKPQRDKMVELQERTGTPYAPVTSRPEKGFLDWLLKMFRDDESEADQIIGS